MTHNESIIKSVMDGNVVQFRELVTSALAQKTHEALGAYKIEVAANLLAPKE